MKQDDQTMLSTLFNLMVHDYSNRAAAFSVWSFQQLLIPELFSVSY